MSVKILVRISSLKSLKVSHNSYSLPSFFSKGEGINIKTSGNNTDKGFSINRKLYFRWRSETDRFLIIIRLNGLS